MQRESKKSLAPLIAGCLQIALGLFLFVFFDVVGPISSKGPDVLPAVLMAVFVAPVAIAKILCGILAFKKKAWGCSFSLALLMSVVLIFITLQYFVAGRDSFNSFEWFMLISVLAVLASLSIMSLILFISSREEFSRIIHVDHEKSKEPVIASEDED